jgi:transcriptional regulator with XRE-family HTH domain
MDTFGERLRSARKESGLSQAAAAKKAGMSQPNLSELEAGKYPTSGMTAALASLYRVSAIWLSEGKGPRKSGDPAPEEKPVQVTPTVTVAQLMAIIEPLLAMARVPLEAVAYPTRADLEARLQAALSGEPAVSAPARSHLDEPLSPEVQALIRKGELLPELPGWDEYDTPELRANHLASLNPATGTGKPR